MFSLVNNLSARAESLSARINCTRCSLFFGSHAIYKIDDLTHVAGTRARLCYHCTQKLLANGHIRRCVLCQQTHARGHRAPLCPLVLPSDRLSIWDYNDLGKAHGFYVELWTRAKKARAAEVEGGLEPQRYQFGYEKFQTIAQFLAETRRALHTRINLKAGIDTDRLGRKTADNTPRRLLGRGLGCGRYTRVEGTNGGGMNCGDYLNELGGRRRRYLCGSCR